MGNHPWDGIIDSLIAKEFDVIAAGMSITDERDEVIDFTQPYLPPTPSIYVALATAGEDALNGKIGAGVSTVHSAYLSESGADFVEIDGSEALFGALLAGNVDAVLVDREFGRQRHSRQRRQALRSRLSDHPGGRNRRRPPRRRWRSEGKAE